MMKRTSAGVARMRMDMIIELTSTDLPEPVVPAMSTWGIFARSWTMAWPSTSSPMATCKGPGPAAASTSGRYTIWRLRLGTSMPT